MSLLRPNREIMLFGTEEPTGETLNLRAGPVTLELFSGMVRNLRIGGIEAIRGIAFLVRDAVWGIIKTRIEDLTVEQDSEKFRVGFTGLCRDGGCELTFQGKVAGDPDGRIRFGITARIHRDFITNRIGLVILHPGRACAGAPVMVTHLDGSKIESTFPRLIKASRPFVKESLPFTDIREISHEVVRGLWATCTLEGGDFEMEDQRNFSDASFKTYTPSMMRPRPFTLKAGEEITHNVSVHFSGSIPPTTEPGPIRVTVGPPTTKRMPALGLGVSAEQAAADRGSLHMLKRAAPRFLVCEVDLTKGHGLAELAAYQAVCDAAGASAVLEVVLDEGANFAILANAVAESKLRVSAVSVFPTAEHRVDEAKSIFPGMSIGGGTNLFFLHLDRNPPPANVDFVTQTTSAIVHAADDYSVMQTLETLSAIIASTRALVSNKPLYMGPSNIGLRLHPHAPNPFANPRQERIVMTSADPRQRGLFAAAWAVGYLSEVVQGGVSAVSLFSPWGPFGIIHCKAGYFQPWYDEVGARIYPSYHLIAGLAQSFRAPVIDTESSDPNVVKCFGYAVGTENILWLANLTGGECEVITAGVDGFALMVILDMRMFVEAVMNPEALMKRARPVKRISEISLGPYAVALVRWPMNNGA